MKKIFTGLFIVALSAGFCSYSFGQSEEKAEKEVSAKKQQKLERKRKLKSEISVDSKDDLIEGVLLYADESGMLVWNDKDGTIDADKLAGNATFIPPSSMIRITRKNKVLGMSVLYGFLIGLAAGIGASEALASDDKELETENAGLAAMGGLTAVGAGVGWWLGIKNGGSPYDEPIDGNSETYLEILPKVKQSTYYKDETPEQVKAFIAKQLE